MLKFSSIYTRNDIIKYFLDVNDKPDNVVNLLNEKATLYQGYHDHKFWILDGHFIIQYSTSFFVEEIYGVTDDDIAAKAIAGYFNNNVEVENVLVAFGLESHVLKYLFSTLKK